MKNQDKKPKKIIKCMKKVIYENKDEKEKSVKIGTREKNEGPASSILWC